MPTILNLNKTYKNFKMKSYLKNICFGNDNNLQKLKNKNFQRKKSINLTSLEITNNRFFSISFNNAYIERFSRCKDLLLGVRFKYLLNIIGDLNTNVDLNIKKINKVLDGGSFNAQEIVTKSYLITNKNISNIT
jgi:hypothetical protein